MTPPAAEAVRRKLLQEGTPLERLYTLLHQKNVKASTIRERARLACEWVMPLLDEFAQACDGLAPKMIRRARDLEDREYVYCSGCLGSWVPGSAEAHTSPCQVQYARGLVARSKAGRA